MSQPLDRRYEMPALGEVDEEHGEFWVDNPFKIAESGENLSAFEKNRIYLNLNGEEFIDVSFASGVDLDSDSRSVICADFDNDGANDILVASVGGGPLRLFLNRIPSRGRKLRIDLTGSESNRMAIGSRVIIEGDGRRIIRDLFPTNGFMGQGPTQLTVGLGEMTQVERLQVRWPTGKTQTFENVAVDARLAITEGSDELQVEPLK